MLGVHEDDEEKEALKIADKICGLRIFEDEAGKMNVNPADAGAQLLIISQFTLFCRLQIAPVPAFPRQRAPKSHTAVRKGHSQSRSRGFEVGTGEFGAEMKVESINDGPVTIILDTREL